MIAPTPALERLRWILDGLNGAPQWGNDVDQHVTSALLSAVPDYADRIRRRTDSYAPLRITGVETSGSTARARIRHDSDAIHVVTCTVEDAAPHRIASAWIAALAPDFLTPRLPDDFSSYGLPRGDGKLIVFAGVPGSGKSTLADATGRRLGIPVFAADWLLGALTPFGGYHLDHLLDIATEQLTTLAVRQLTLGQSAILDAPVEELRTRDRWQSLAARAGAAFHAFVCVCSDRTEHRRRVETRTRGIPGWHDAGHWPNVVRRLESFPQWDEALILDTMRPRDDLLGTVVDTVAA